MKTYSLCLIFLLLAIPSFAPNEVTYSWTNSAGIPVDGIYEMQVTYDNGLTWQTLLDNIPVTVGATSSAIVTITNKQYQVRVRAWDSPLKTFYSLWSDSSDLFMLLEVPGKPTVTIIIK